MTTWQRSLVDSLRVALGDEAVHPYGSYTSGELDGWSDLDVELDVSVAVARGQLGPLDSAALFGGEPWAWQDSRSDGVQTLRVVLADGRRVDARVRGGELDLPPAPDDLAIRFDAVLAATRIGRGNRLIGLHLVLGILRETLVLGMLLADRETGTDHHRSGTPHDALADEVAALLGRPVDLSLVTAACDLHAEARARLDPASRADWSGLAAVIRRATSAPDAY
jgi:hypothetical protein